ncbi:MAG: type II toxin-antitoxin system HicB family antitoxin [Sphingomicrobium sp.]
MATYLGVVEREEDSFGVFFPDVPGCVSAGDSLFEAMENGEQALAAHLELLAREGEELPEASSEVAVDDDIDVAGYFLARVELPGKTVRLNITMDEGLVARIDRVASNRSAFLAEAARERLRELADAY